MTAPVPPPAPTTYTCKNCPQKPQFLTKDALLRHWSDTHTVAMIETVSEVTALGQQISLSQLGLQPIVRKHVDGPDI